MERRAAGRCPVCQGPAIQDAGMPEGLRCRNSICTFNHQAEVCPRCGGKGLESVSYKDQQFQYTCSECLNKWLKPK